ncbi:hypothetical protein BdWA1_002109 [Babesia duncani]|uniref:F-box domain-containing protein n=1 Tax=Babesia duncani TaxID=323732 RepID=A0AAD9PLH8_9APIC|nr:hypothetical protein BdWA1_002109 [Babesia duncani]
MGGGGILRSRFKCFSFKKSASDMRHCVVDPHIAIDSGKTRQKECNLSPSTHRNECPTVIEPKEAVTAPESFDVYDPFVNFRSKKSVSKVSKDAKLAKITDSPPVVDSKDDYLGYGVFVLRGDSITKQSNTRSSKSESVEIKTSDANEILTARSDVCERNWYRSDRFFDVLINYLTAYELHSCQLVCNYWNKNIKRIINQKCEELVKKFKRTYGDSLQFQKWSLLYHPIYTAERGIRIDILIRAKILPTCSMYKNHFGYTYNYACPRFTSRGLLDGGTTPTYISKFVFECLQKHCVRTLSFIKDLSSMHGDDLHVAAESTYHVCEGDLIEFPISFYNPIGNLSVESVRFSPMQRDNLELDAGNKIDQMHREWYTVEPNSKYLAKMFPENIETYAIAQPDRLLPQLQHRYTQVAGIDIITSRSLYMAHQTGAVPEASKIIGHDLEVIDRNKQVLCMLQKVGIQHDRTCNIQMRIGDKVHFYLTRE